MYEPVLTKLLDNLDLKDRDKYSFEKTARYIRLVKEGYEPAIIGKQLCESSDLCHELKAMSLVKDLVTFTPKVIERCSYCFDMARSHVAYNTDRDVEKIVDDEYFIRIDLPRNVKSIIVQYVISIVEKVDHNVYTDSEGCSYNSLVIKEFPLN